jgi:two-component system, NtrC family, sensor histidine kinase HydH
VLTRPLALKLLAPTVLVSLALVSACSFGAVYLNRLHVNVSEELSENVQSTRVADSLEAVTAGLVNLLDGDPADPKAMAEVGKQNERARDLLQEAERLANLEQEKVLVGQIRDGLQEYLAAWERRGAVPPGQWPAADHRLQGIIGRVLQSCRALRSYNARQIEVSDRENQAIVQRLQWGLLTVGLGAPMSGLLLGYAVARSLHHSIYQLSVGIRDAAGRLNRELGSVTLEEEGDLPDLHRRVQGIIAEVERVVDQLQQREREVLRAEQLAAVGQVAAGVAHELRNPLTSVKMLVQTGLEGEPPAGLAAEELAIIEHEVRRMEQCIQLFLDFARPPRSERRRTDLVPVLRRAAALVEGRARRQKVTLVTDLPEEPVFLLIDPEQVHQVAVNLLLNALDALPRGGTVWVESVRPEARGSKENGRPGIVEVRVRDTGPGIAPRVRSRLFEPFVSSKDTGLGLGLSISKRLIEAHGGTIRGDDAPEGGAQFAFTLPA